MKSALLLLAAACMLGNVVAAPLAFSAEEQRAIAALGPWPPAPALDAGNAHAHKAEVIALGRELFFDKRLSVDASMSCASCHQPERGFSDGRAKAQGRSELARNTPSLWNTVFQRWYGWDGASDSLWSQALRAMTASREMAATPAHLRQLLDRDAKLAQRLEAATGEKTSADEERTAVMLAKTIGAWVGSLVSPRTPFDDFRDALQGGDTAAVARYPQDAQRGLQLFVGRGKCLLCHGGPNFSHGEFADIGLPFFVRPGVVDPGRHGGITQLRASRYNLLGPWSDAPEGAAALKTRHVDLQHRNFGEFKVPSLRGVAETAPYMHDGQLATLADVVRHYSQINLERLHADGERVLEPLQLSAAEASDLEAFLRSLSPAAPAPQHSAVIERHPAFASMHVQPRDVQVWLPPGYAQEPTRRYPVLYLHDGQNVFEAPAGGSSWQIGDTAQRLMQAGEVAPAIIVAVSSGATRIHDYTPVAMPLEGRLMGGGAPAYRRFLLDELKPFIDRHYRSRPGRDNTALGGSSLGALVTMWLLLQEPQTFGAGLIVSPSVWWAERAILRDVASAALAGQRPRLWLSTGLREPGSAVPGTRQLRDALLARAWSVSPTGQSENAELFYVEAPEAEHHERAWAAQVEGMLRFLYSKPR